MFKLPRRLLLPIVLSASCLLTLPLCAVVFFDRNFGCFGTIYPTERDIEIRANINLPPSTANIEWRCHSFLQKGEIFVRFTIAPTDKPLVTDSLGYYARNLSLTYFFDLFEDNPPNEEDLEVYETLQANSTCGWTNLLIDMDDPSIYTVYADYEDWEDC